MSETKRNFELKIQFGEERTLSGNGFKQPKCRGKLKMIDSIREEQ